jgi:hypothetical protein
MTDPVNPIYAESDSSSGLIHAGEAPPAGHAFLPTAHCGAVMTGDRLENRPPVDDLCAIDAKWLGIDKPASEPEKTTPKPSTAEKKD